MKLFKTNAFRFEELHAWLQEHVKPLSIMGQWMLDVTVPQPY